MRGARLGNFAMMEIRPQRRYVCRMSDAARPLPDFDESAAELVALTAAVAEARAETGSIPHSDVRAWLLEVAAGNFTAPPPVPR